MFCISEPIMLVGAKAEQKHCARGLHARFCEHRLGYCPRVLKRTSVCSPISFFHWHNNKNVLFLVRVYIKQT